MATSLSDLKFNRDGRIRFAATALGVKLPAWRGRKPVLMDRSPKGECRFIEAINRHYSANEYRHVVGGLIDDFFMTRHRLTDTQKRGVLHTLARILGVEVSRSRRPGRRNTRARRAHRAVSK